eukprot:TRINITY_DN31174_c0_g1_i8.p1 TRINITY_DN31174_c0_g1~~TRINITY_DN31174_c0_g1_i8.p1  ORF type:complete len:395 (-),score=11.29 TRINITY_DN31174_c0_g1_i8:55-1239(-)
MAADTLKAGLSSRSRALVLRAFPVFVRVFKLWGHVVFPLMDTYSDIAVSASWMQDRHLRFYGCLNTGVLAFGLAVQMYRNCCHLDILRGLQNLSDYHRGRFHPVTGCVLTLTTLRMPIVACLDSIKIVSGDEDPVNEQIYRWSAIIEMLFEAMPQLYLQAYVMALRVLVHRYQPSVLDVGSLAMSLTLLIHGLVIERQKADDSALELFRNSSTTLLCLTMLYGGFTKVSRCAVHVAVFLHLGWRAWFFVGAMLLIVYLHLLAFFAPVDNPRPIHSMLLRGWVCYMVPVGFEPLHYPETQSLLYLHITQALTAVLAIWLLPSSAEGPLLDLRPLLWCILPGYLVAACLFDVALLTEGRRVCQPKSLVEADHARAAPVSAVPSTSQASMRRERTAL